VAAFAINTCAYTTEILHGTMRAVPAGEIEAARAFGMSRWMVLRRIVLPSAFRRSLPAYSNEVVLMLHGTALASVVTLHESDRRAAREFNSTYYLPFEAFITAAVFYGLITGAGGPVPRGRAALADAHAAADAHP
jgi:arginine/ornithine transport system permease protein